MPKIKDYLLHKDQYKVDTTYQRPPDAWSKEDKQCLIDTILRGEPIPLFFLNLNSDKEVYFIVDGQQRLDAISDFYNKIIKLNKKYSGQDLQGKSFDNIPNELREKFLNYDLKFHIMKDYDDERVRLIFSRLQRGKPLQLGERLNAAPGEIVKTMREIARRPFLTKSVGLYKERYGVYPDAARMLFYEKYGPMQCGSNELYNFFTENEMLSIKSFEYKKSIAVLNILEKCFPPTPGDYKYFEKHSWVIAVYSMMSEIIKFYVVDNKEEEIKKFVRKFHSLVYNEDFRKSNYNYQKYYDIVRGGWSEKLMKLRRDLLINELLTEVRLKEKDSKRQITNEEKISKYSEVQICEYCHDVEFKDYKEGEYHHIEHYAKGGISKTPNIMLLCKNCHKLIHGKGKIKITQIDDNGEEEE
jgi:hypothetical protein